MKCNVCSRQFLCKIVNSCSDVNECKDYKSMRDVEVVKIGDDEIVQNKIRKFK